MNDPTPESSDASAESELASALSALTPAAARLDAPAALFAAGRVAAAADARRSLHRTLAAWRSLAAVLAVVTAGSIVANVRLMSDRSPAIAETAPNASQDATPTEPVAPPLPQPSPQPAPSPDRLPSEGTLAGSPASPAGADLLTLRRIALAQGIDALPRQSFGTSTPPMSVGGGLP